MPLEEHISQTVEEKSSNSQAYRFNFAELGSPGGIAYGALLRYPDHLGTVATVSLSDGRTSEIREEHNKLGLKYIAGDLLGKETWEGLRKAASGDGYDVIFAYLVSGWQVGIPNEPALHLLLLKRAVRLLRPGGILISDYYPDNARFLEERGKKVAAFYAARHPNFKLEISVNGIFRMRKLM